MIVRALSLALLFAALSFQALAGEVEVSGVHLCCASCVKGVDNALKDVDGVTNVKSDRASKTVKFTAANDKAAAAGIEAFAKAGFHGTAKHGESALKFPDSGAKDGAKASQIKVGDVHLCCGACVRAAEEAIQKVDGVANITSDRDASSIEITGDNIGVQAVVKALNDAGFNATIQ